MPSDVTEPSPVPPHDDPPPGDGGVAPTVPAPLSSTSGDELTLSLSHARPDPLLGDFTAGTASNPVVPPPFDALGGLDLSAPSPAGKGAASEEDSDDDEPALRSSLTLILLASYASAVTLGLAWVLGTGRRPREPAAADAALPAETRPDPGLRAGRARRVVPPPPLPADRLVALGDSVRLGQIEVTPLGVSSGPVVLERIFGGHETRGGGTGALKLRLRLRNVSADVVVAPLDEAFVRDRPPAEPDSFIEVPSGGPPVGQYPLAVTSEWTVVGQDFRDLKPGEAYETLVVSAPDAAARVAPEMIWRVRLRTDLNHTDDLGVRFRASEVRPEPPAPPPPVRPGRSADPDDL